jgi:predicted methyltransferase
MQEHILMRIGQRSSTLAIAATTAAIILGGCAATSPSADRAPPSLNAEQIAAIVASPDRSAGDRTNDVRRKPVEMLVFIGVRPGMTAFDVSAGGGYTTELIARSVGSTGRVYGQSAPPNPQPVVPAAPEGGDGMRPAAAPAAPPPPRRTTAMALAERAKNPAASSIVSVQMPYSSPIPPELASQSLDLVTLMFNYHDFGFMGVDRTTMNAAIFKALKPGGLYVIADHAGRAGTGISESGTLHRVEEEFVVREVEAAGFKLAERGTFLRNPNDPRDKNTPEPAMPKDEFVLKFVKPKA